MAVSGSRHVTSCTGCLCETSLTHVGTWLPLPCPCLIVLCWSTATSSISSHWSPRPPLLMTSGRLVLPPGHQLAFSPPPNNSTDFLSCCKEFVSKMLTTFALLSTFFPTNLFTEKSFLKTERHKARDTQLSKLSLLKFFLKNDELLRQHTVSKKWCLLAPGAAVVGGYISDQSCRWRCFRTEDSADTYNQVSYCFTWCPKFVLN